MPVSIRLQIDYIYQADLLIYIIGTNATKIRVRVSPSDQMKSICRQMSEGGTKNVDSLESISRDEKPFYDESGRLKESQRILKFFNRVVEIRGARRSIFIC